MPSGREADHRADRGALSLDSAVVLLDDVVEVASCSYRDRLTSTAWRKNSDLIVLSEQERRGVVLFVDSADVFLAENSRGMFRVIEAFLTQVDEWMQKKKPCHLCFQMEADESLRARFVMS